MKALKWIGIALVGYIALVVAFESMIGILQPQAGETLVITTTDSDGEQSDRVLARVESGGRLYVSANHWPRAWYEAALANPEVEVTIEGQRGAYRAVPIGESEHERLDNERPHPFAFRFVTGFPPRRFLRLDPLTPSQPG